jgi:hypothetical protein
MSEIGRLQQQLKSQQQPDKTPNADFNFTYEDWGDDAGIQKLSALHERLKRIESHFEEEQSKQELGSIESFFGQLDATLKPVFGEGESGGMEESSPEWQKRQELVDKASELRAGYAALNGKEMSLKDSLEQALHIVASQEMRDAKVAALRGKISRRERQRSIPPDSRTQRTQPKYDSPEAEAAAKVEAKLRARGYVG